MTRTTSSAARPRLAGACAAVVAAAASWAPAQAEDLYGSAAIITNRSCSTSIPTCTTGGAFAPGVVRLQPNQLYGGYQSQGSESVSLLGGASAAGGVAFGAEYLPTLRVGSWAGAETRTGMTITSFRAFTYTGDQAIDLALTGQLHFINSGDVAGPVGGDDYAGDGGLNMAFGILKVGTVAAAFGPGADANSIISNSDIDFPDCSGSGVVAAGGYSSAGTSAGEHTQAIGLGTGCGGGAITLNKGDSFVVIATLQALSNRGGFADATHTFTVQYDTAHTYFAGTHDSVGDGFFSDTVVTGAAVPEPAAWALMIAGLGLAGGSLRRRRAAMA
jgi:hypothetical protein